MGNPPDRITESQLCTDHHEPLSSDFAQAVTIDRKIIHRQQNCNICLCPSSFFESTQFRERSWICTTVFQAVHRSNYTDVRSLPFNCSVFYGYKGYQKTPNLPKIWTKLFQRLHANNPHSSWLPPKKECTDSVFDTHTTTLLYCVYPRKETVLGDA